MVTLVKNPVMEKRQSIRVFLYGNNPADLSNIYDQITSIRKVKFITDYSFDLRGLVNKISSFNPNCLLVDDNMEKSDLKKLFVLLKGNHKTAQIPITIVQNSNKDDKPREGADGFILKHAMTSESLLNTIVNTLKMNNLQDFLKGSYLKRKSLLFNWK